MDLNGKQFKGYWRDGDDDIYQRNQPYAKGGRLTDLLRLMMYVFWRLPVPDELYGLAQETGAFDIAQAFPGPDIVDDLDELRMMMLEFDERLSAIEQVEVNAQEIKHLWREMGRMNERLERLRVTGAVEDDEVQTPAADPDDARQAALTNKLRNIKQQFNVLKQ